MKLSKEEWNSLPDSLMNELEELTKSLLKVGKDWKLSEENVKFIMKVGAAAALKSVNLLPKEQEDYYKPYQWLK